MTCKWIRVVSGATPYALDFLPVNTKIDGAAVVFGDFDSDPTGTVDVRPSVMTLTGNASWLSNVGKYWEASRYPCSMSLTKGAAGTSFVTWVNSMSLGEPQNLPHMVSAMVRQIPLDWSKQAPQKLLYRLSHLISDVVCFANRDLVSAAGQFVE